jgi:PleD family two-component response regulator
MDLAAARDIAESWRAKVNAYQFSFKPASMGDDGAEEPVTITASFGVAQLVDAMLLPTDLLRIADLKLYEAKSAGRNRVAA